MNHVQITNAVAVTLNCAAEASSTGGVMNNGVLIGTPDSAIQYALVGDALILVEKDQPQTRAAARLCFLLQSYSPHVSRKYKQYQM